MIDRIRARPLLDGYRGDPPAEIDGLARIVSQVSRGLVGTGLSDVELNPVVWDGAEWVVLDLLIG
jgi:hypothetical protein